MTQTLNTEDIAGLLRVDPLAEAEKVTGKSYKTDESTSNLGLLLHLGHNERKRKALQAANDSYFHIGYEEYLRLMGSLGFEGAYITAFEGHNGPEDFAILWHEDGILATAESYGEGLNSSKVYYNILRDQTCEDWWSRTSSGGFHLPSYDAGLHIWVGDHDGREGIRTNLTRLREAGAFQKTWVKRPFLWLLTYAETKVEDYDYKAINEARINALPQHVREAITPEETA